MVPLRCVPAVSWFWGARELNDPLLITPLTIDLFKLLFLATVYCVCEPRKHVGASHAFTISEVFAWHQRQDGMAREGTDQKGLTRVTAMSPRTATAERMEQGPLRLRSFRRGMVEVEQSEWSDAAPSRKPRACAALELAFGGFSCCAWLVLLYQRRPWGLALALLCVLLSGSGLMLCPLPEDPDRRTIRNLAGHYVFAVLTFASLAGALAAGRGPCDPAFLGFLCVVTVSGISGITTHSAAVRRHASAHAGLTLLTAALEWSSVVFFYVVLMLPLPEQRVVSM